jgi:hypothetical protein
MGTPGRSSDIYRSLSVLATGAVVKTGPGALTGYYLSNSGAAARYVKLYDKATAPTEADTPKLTLFLGAAPFVANLHFGDSGPGFAHGIGIRATTEAADNGTTAPGAGEVIANIYYRGDG